MMMWAIIPLVIAHRMAVGNDGVVPPSIIANCVVTLVYCSKVWHFK